jgi:hypothetical protein
MKYTVTFTQYWTYDVEAKTTQEAESLAHEIFLRDMYRPVAITSYDEVEVDPDVDEEDADGYEEEKDYWKDS